MSRPNPRNHASTSSRLRLMLGGAAGTLIRSDRHYRADLTVCPFLTRMQLWLICDSTNEQQMLLLRNPRCRMTWMVFGFCLAVSTGSAAGQEAVRSPTGAGTWFPADPDSLRAMVERYLAPSDGRFVSNKPVALIVPHAGYQYSGAVAGTAYATIRGHSYRRVIVLGISHRTPLRGASVLDVAAYETPLGRVPVDGEVRDALLESDLVTVQPTAHVEEHSVENQLPMLQQVLGDFEVVGVLVGEMTADERAELGSALRNLIDDETLLVASTDFTHHGPAYGYTVFDDEVPERLRSLNDMAAQELIELDTRGWDSFLERTEATICGRNAVGLLLTVFEPDSDVGANRLAVDMSGRMTGDWTNSVTYAALAFWQIGDRLGDGDQKTLLRLARDAATSYFDSTVVLAERHYQMSHRLMAPGAAFVTLEDGPVLRGCVGHITAVEPLYLSVARNAFRSGQDPRFEAEPVTADEVGELAIEVSVLTPLRRLVDPEAIVVGRDGLFVVRGQQHGVLLPNVPIKEGWDRAEFLAAACLKAGLPPDAWEDPETEMYRFEAHVFGEHRGTATTHQRR